MIVWHKDCSVKGMMRQLYKGAVAGIVVAMATGTSAMAYDALIEGAKQCTRYFPLKEREQGIPVHLLAAISSIETGRYHKGLGMALPWPWTINVEGKGYFFQTKAEAIAETRRHLQSGRTSIDVGCMQVNLKHHPDAFTSLEDAFDPEKNVGYAAKFLRTNYGQLGNSWVKAAAAYHSRTPSRGNPYLQKVAGAWQKIVTKVQEAQARSGGMVQMASLENTPAQVTEPAVYNARPQMRPIPGTRNVKVISVKGDNTLSAERAPVMVIAPTSETRVASYAPSAGSPQASPAMTVQADAPVSPKRVSVDNRGGESHTNRSPTFVFAN